MLCGFAFDACTSLIRGMAATAHLEPQEAETRLRAALERSGQRFTEQRAAVYRFLASTDEHPNADEVFTSVRRRIPDISLATVYKALETLVGCGLAAKLAHGEGSARYDARMDDHCHSRCLRCGAVRDAPGAPPASVPGVEVEAGFRIRGVHVEVVGVCPRCAA
jgi:Fe2+ or Zn2+ uptake regulation protein